MGAWQLDAGGRPILQPNGCFKAIGVPAGFLKLTPAAIGKFMKAWPELVYGEAWRPSVDLFNRCSRDP